MADKRSGNYPAHRSSSHSTEERLGVAANLAGMTASLASVAGFLLSLRSGDGLWLLCGLGTAVFFLYAAWRRRRMAVAASAVILAMVGVGGLLAHFHVLVKPAAASPSADAPAVTLSTAPNGSSSTPSATQPDAGSSSQAGPGSSTQAGTVSGTQAGTSAPQPRVLEITLPRHAAVDLDYAGQPEAVSNQFGATGPYDLYHDGGEAGTDEIRAQDGVYSYPADTSPDSAYGICSDYTSAAPSVNTYNPFVYVNSGTPFCFRTTAGKLAWATVEAVQPDTYAVVLQVFIWG